MITPDTGLRISGRRRLAVTCMILVMLQAALIGDMASLKAMGPTDVAIFQCYALGFWDGAPHVAGAQAGICRSFWHGSPQRFHSLPPEYPLLAQAVFSLPLLLPWLSYFSAFMWWMDALLLISTALLAFYRLAEVAIAFALYSLIAGWTVLLERFDLLPGLCIILALSVAQRAKLRAAAAALAAGTLLKLFPLVLIPLILIERRRSSRRPPWDLIAVVAGILLGGILIAIAIDPGDLWSPLEYQIARPAQIESMPATMVWITTSLTGGQVKTLGSYNSLNVIGSGAGFWNFFFTMIWIAGLGVAYGRRLLGRDSLGRSFLAVLLITVATGKVFSTQYILWPLWVAAFVEGLRLRWLLLAGLTLLIGYCWTQGVLTPLMLEAIWSRNAVLCGLTLFYVAGPGDMHAVDRPGQPSWHRLSLRRPRS